LVTKEPVKAAYERSDWCVVPAGAVAGEAMVALVLADAFFLQKFGGDSLAELRRNFDNYARQIDEFLKPPATAAIEDPAKAPSAARKILFPSSNMATPSWKKPGAPVKNIRRRTGATGWRTCLLRCTRRRGRGNWAAPQIGKSLRIAGRGRDRGGKKNPEAKIVLANPEIIHAEGEVFAKKRGCLFGSGISRLRVAARNL